MLQVNNRSYRLPTVPTVVVCVDGCEPDYLGQAVGTGHMPWLKAALAKGTRYIQIASFSVPSTPLDANALALIACNQ